MFKNIRNLRIRIRDTVHNIIKIQITRQKSKGSGSKILTVRVPVPQGLPLSES